jgi:L-asparaginase
VEILARIEANLATAPLAGFVCEGMSPFGMADPAKNTALSVAILAGMPVVRTGRGNTGGMAYRTDPIFISGNNLTATKARMLLMAALLKLGALPPAADPFHPTYVERAATEQAVARYQTLFDTH